MALHPVDIVLGQVDAAAGTLHDRPGRHDAAWHCFELAVDDVGDGQLVGGEVVLILAVVPDVGVTVFLVGFVLGVRPLADPLIGGVAVPFSVPISQWATRTAPAAPVTYCAQR